jgi:hypothetical protein
MGNNDMDLKLLRGLPIEVYRFGKIHPLKLDEISKIGELKYNQYLSSIIFNQETLKIEGKKLSKFETLMVCSLSDETFRNVIIHALHILFKEEIHLHQGGFFYLGDINHQRIITPEIYEEIVRLVKQQNFIKDNKEEEEQFNPHDEKAAKLIEKLKHFRQKVKEKNAEEGLNLSDIISIVATYSGNLNMFNVWDLTVYQLYTIYIRLMMKENYETQIYLLPHSSDPNSSELKNHLASKINT